MTTHDFQKFQLILKFPKVSFYVMWPLCKPIRTLEHLKYCEISWVFPFKYFHLKSNAVHNRSTKKEYIIIKELKLTFVQSIIVFTYSFKIITTIFKIQAFIITVATIVWNIIRILVTSSNTRFGYISKRKTPLVRYSWVHYARVVIKYISTMHNSVD